MVDKLATRVCMKECDRRSMRAESEEKRRYWALRARKYGAALVADEHREAQPTFVETRKSRKSWAGS